MEKHECLLSFSCLKFMKLTKVNMYRTGKVNTYETSKIHSLIFYTTLYARNHTEYHGGIREFPSVYSGVNSDG